MTVSDRSDCFREFARYSLLNVFGMLGLSCYILADTFFVSYGLGTDGLAALNLAIPVYSFIHGCGLMIGMGGGTKYSLHKNMDSTMETDQLFTNAVMFAVMLSVGFIFAGIFFSGRIAALLGAEAQVFFMTKIYLQVILLFSPFFLMNNVLLCFVRNDGAPQLSMRAMLTGSLSNILLDYVFIFPCHMGIFGAVFATGLAPVISILMLSPHLLHKQNRFHLTKCRLSARWLPGIITSGIPSFVTEVSSGIVMMIFNRLILNLAGNTGVAAYGVIANLSLVVISIYTGISQGIQPLASRYSGTGNIQKALAVFRYAVTAMLLFSLLVYAGIFFGAEQISSIFNREQNEMLQNIASKGLRLYFTACPFAGFNIVVCTYFTSSAHPFPANMISILRGFVIIIPLAFIFAAAGGMTGVWCAFPCAELTVSGIGLLFFFQVRKQKTPFS